MAIEGGMDMARSLVCAACVSVVVCQDSKVDQVFKHAEASPVLKTIIKMKGAVTTEERDMANKTGIAIYNFKEVEVRPWVWQGEGEGDPLAPCLPG